MFKLRSASIIFAGLCCLAMAGCTALEINRNIEDALGSAARTRVQQIGSPNRDCYLVRLNFSKAYAVVVPNRILRLGEEFKQVNVVSQFSGRGVDNAVLQCVRANGSVENYLLQVLSGSQLALYRLESDSRDPFKAGLYEGEHLLVQNTAGPNVRYWFVAPENVRGPKLISRASLNRQKTASGKSRKSGKATASAASQNKTSASSGEAPAADLPTADLPSIRQDSTVRLEMDTGAEKSAPAAEKPAPAAVEKPKTDAGAAQPAPPAATQGAPAKPYTIVID